jgi:hypothetical protein
VPRNEFENHDKLEGFTDLQIKDMLERGECTTNDVRIHRGLPPVREVPVPVEAADQEVAPVEDDPHMWPAATRPQLEQLRRVPGLSTTQRHIAEKYGIEDVELP